MEPGRETAVIFAELLGAEELGAASGEQRAHEEIERSSEKLGQAASASGARVVKRVGSRLMLVAATPDAAAATAVAMQLAAGNLESSDPVRLGLGVGFHYGPVIQRDDGDVFGDTVNLAARLVEQAARGQILLDDATAQQLGSLYRRSARRLYAVALKGLKDEVSLCELVWRADDPATLYPLDAANSGPERVKLKLKYRGQKLVLRRTSEALSIGRGADCGLVVSDEHASRLHCTIQRRRERFVLSDKSTNGTFVSIDGDEEVLLQREDLTLRKHGWITFGRPREALGADDAVEFSCDD